MKKWMYVLLAVVLVCGGFLIRKDEGTKAELPEETPGMACFTVYSEAGEGVTEIKLDCGGTSLTSFSDGSMWMGGGFIDTSINLALCAARDAVFSYRTESGYSYATTVSLQAGDTIITLLPVKDGGGISLAYPEAAPSDV